MTVDVVAYDLRITAEDETRMLAVMAALVAATDVIIVHASLAVALVTAVASAAASFVATIAAVSVDFWGSAVEGLKYVGATFIINGMAYLFVSYPFVFKKLLMCSLTMFSLLTPDTRYRPVGS